MTTSNPSIPARARPAPWPVQFYRSAVGKKWAMAVTGIILLGFVLLHMLGNLKIYISESEFNHYGEGLRTVGSPFLPREGALWIIRIILLVAVVIHIHAAWTLTLMNRRSRPVPYAGGRNYVAATYAARTMRWSGIIVALFILFHLADLTLGWVNPDFEHGEVYRNEVASLSRIPVGILYIVANLALGLHIYHGAWSLFQSLGINNPRINAARKLFAQGLTALIVLGNISFPVLIMAGVID